MGSLAVLVVLVVVAVAIAEVIFLSVFARRNLGRLRHARQPTTSSPPSSVAVTRLRFLGDAVILKRGMR